MNTRICITANGNADMGILHMGHAYLALVNEYAAHSTGGKFWLRFDDAQIPWVNLLGEANIRLNCLQIQKELTWLGIECDGIGYHSMEKVWVNPIIKDCLGCEESAAYSEVPVATWTRAPQYPYTEYLTAENVILDAHESIDTVICGEELLSRWGLYLFIQKKLNLPKTNHIFIPRLKTMYGGEINSVSKTIGRNKLRDCMLRGDRGEDIADYLASLCKKDYYAGWDTNNLRDNPILLQ